MAPGIERRLAAIFSAGVVGCSRLTAEDEGRIVRWVANHPRNKTLMAVPGRFDEQQLAWAVSRRDNELRQEVNRVLADWKASGKVDEIIDRWLPPDE